MYTAGVGLMGALVTLFLGTSELLGKLATTVLLEPGHARENT